MQTTQVRSDQYRDELLKAVVENFTDTTNPYLAPLVPLVLDRATEYYEWLGQLKRIDRRQTALINQHTAQLKERYDDLDWQVRRFWNYVIDRTKAMRHPKDTFALFGLTERAKRPSMKNRANIRDCARKVIDGDAIAVAQGLPAMAGPVTATSVAALLAEVESLETARRKAKEVYELNLIKLEDHRKLVTVFVAEVRAYMRARMSGLPQNKQQKLQQVVGFLFEPSASKQKETGSGTSTKELPIDPPADEPAEPDDTGSETDEPAGDTTNEGEGDTTVEPPAAKASDGDDITEPLSDPNGSTGIDDIKVDLDQGRGLARAAGGGAIRL